MLDPTLTPALKLSCPLLVGLVALAPWAGAQESEDLKLVATAGQANDQFGSAVAADAARLAVGASGSAYVFSAASGAQQIELAPLGNALGFGASVAIDDPYVVVGAPLTNGAAESSGKAYVFDSSTGEQLFELEASDAADEQQFGVAVAIDGELIVVGALNAAYLFDASTGQQLEKLLPDGGPPVGGTGIATIAGGFGQAVDIEGGLIVVGAKSANGASLYSGSAYVFDTGGDELQQLSAGAAWTQFGGSVGIDDGTVVVGATFASPNGKDSGQAYLFDALTGAMIDSLVPSDGHIFAHFGSAVGIDGPLVVIGAEQDNGEGPPDSGAVYLYPPQGGSPIAKLIASDASSSDDLGAAVAVAGGVVVAGAPGDDDNGSSAGAAYVFTAAGTANAMTECLGNDGALDHVGGLAIAGQTLVLRMDDAQPSASLAVLLASAAPAPGWPSCGIDLGGAGELLIDVTPPLLLTATAPWTGTAVDFSAPVPPIAGLAGVGVYFQGAFAAPVGSEPVRLTHGLEVLLGGFL